MKFMNAVWKVTAVWAVLSLGAFAAHAATPTVFSSGQVIHPNGIVATPTVLLVSSQDQPQDSPGVFHTNIYSLDTSGHATLFSTIGGATMSLQEVYMVAAPGVGGGWTAFDVFACRGNKVFKIPSGGGAVTTPFATLTGAVDRAHCDLTFDRVGTFGFDMIVTTEGDGAGGSIGGGIYRVTPVGGPVAAFKVLPYVASPPTANITEGPSVVSTGFSGASGELLVAQEDNAGGTIFHISNSMAVGTYTTAIKDPESIKRIPQTVCDFDTVGGGFFITDFNNNAILKYPASDFAGLGGNELVPIEFTTAGNNIKMIAALNGAITDFDSNAGSPTIVHEGSMFVECGPATIPIIKHSTDPNTPPTNADFIFGLYPRADASFTNPPTGSAPNILLGSTFFNYAVNAADGTVSCAALPPPFNGMSVRGTCILTPPENNLAIPLGAGTFDGAVCELKHTTGWTFGGTFTATFTGTPVSGINSASAPYHPTGETTDLQIECINLVIQPGTTEVDLNVSDTPPTQPTGGRFTGGGSFFPTGPNDTPSDTSERITHGFELHCNPATEPNTLEVNWAGTGNGKNAENNFHMDNLTEAQCIDDPNIEEGPPEAPLNTYEGIGTGKFNGVAGATAHWVLTDDGEPGVNDEIWIEIWDETGKLVLRIGNFTGSKTTLLSTGALGALVTVPGSAGDAGSHLDKGNQQAHK